MVTYVLIMMILTGSGDSTRTALATAEFNGKSRCEAAGKKWFDKVDIRPYMKKRSGYICVIQ